MADQATGADGAGRGDEFSVADPVVDDTPGDTAPPLPTARRRRRRAVIVIVVALVLLTAILGWQDVQVRRGEQIRESMVAAGRAGVLALTTVDHERIDDDVQRILDTSTGKFRDDFAQRAESFKDAARKVASKSVGTVVESGVESVDGDRGRVLVSLIVMTSNLGAPEQQPKSWRTRVSVIKDGGTFKVSAVEFIS